MCRFFRQILQLVQLCKLFTSKRLIAFIQLHWKTLYNNNKHTYLMRRKKLSTFNQTPFNSNSKLIFSRCTWTCFTIVTHNVFQVFSRQQLTSTKLLILTTPTNCDQRLIFTNYRDNKSNVPKQAATQNVANQRSVCVHSANRNEL